MMVVVVTYGLSREEYLAHLDADAARFAAVLAAADLATPVPSCPGWDLAALAAHVGRVHRWSAGKVADGVTGRSDPPADAPGDPEEVRAWSAASYRGLVDALRETDPEATVWTMDDTGTVGFWYRRQALELLVHRWDAQNAVGVPDPFDSALSADGIAELTDVFYARRVAEGRLDPLPSGIAFLPTDVERGPLVLGPTGSPPAATVTGPAAEILTTLWGRTSLGETTLRIDGDADLVRAALASAIVP